MNKVTKIAEGMFRRGSRNHRRQRQRNAPLCVIQAEHIQAITGKAQCRSRCGCALCTEKHPSGGEAETRMQPTISVFISPAAHGVCCCELRTTQSVQDCNQSSHTGRGNDCRARASGGSPDAHKDARTNDGPQPHHRRAENTNLSSESR